MQRSIRNNKLRRSEIAAYGCVGSAAVFILALTFGAFDAPAVPQHFAANDIAPISDSTR